MMSRALGVGECGCVSKSFGSEAGPKDADEKGLVDSLRLRIIP